MSPKVAYVYGKCIILLNLHSFLIRYKKALNGIHHPADLMLFTWLCSSFGNATIKISSRITVVTQKWESCIPWNPTLPREAHENVFIRNDLPSMCRGLFPSATWGRTKL